MRRWLALVLCTFSVAVTAAPATVESFVPQGTVKGVRQASARFTEAMVAFGDPRLVEPFTIDCPIAGTGRWADPRNWVYDFERDLPAGLRCTFRLQPGVRTLDGATIEAAGEFAFTTGGPAIVQSLPYEGATIDEEQVFLLGLDAPVDPQSVAAHAHCVIGGIAERVGVRVLAGEERGRALEARKDFLGRYFSWAFRGGRGLSVYFMRAPAGGTDDERFLALKDAADSPLVALACQRRFPAEAEVSLVWGAGIATANGLATEQDQTLAFKVREPFRARFTCERVNKDAGCIPVLPMYLGFSAPVARADAERIVLKDKAGVVRKAVPTGDSKAPFVEGVRFDGPFPEKTAYALELPAPLADDAGRPLANQSSFPLAVATDEDPPLAKFPASFGIIELNADATLPVTVRNIEATLGRADAEGESNLVRVYRELRARYWPEPATIDGRRLRVRDPAEFVGWLRRIHEVQGDRGHYDEAQDKYVYEQRAGEVSVFSGENAETFSVPRQGGEREFEVVGIPLTEPGLHIVELASPRLGAALLAKPQPYHAQAAALVTNLAAHFKYGRESSLVWVTSLDKARPVAGASVTVADCAGEVYFEGETDDHGIARIDRELPAEVDLPGCVGYDRALVVSAALGDDVTFTLSSWNEGIATWRFDLPRPSADTPYLINTVFDRTLLRPGETVHMKHVIRLHTGAGFAFPERGALPEKLIIQHQGSEDRYELDLAWDEQGIAEGIWTIPAAAKQGIYELRLPGELRRWSEYTVSDSFRVEAFRVPTMSARLQPVMADVVNSAEAPIDIQVNYLAGGGASGAVVKVRGLVQPRAIEFDDHEGFVFANGDVREGPEREEAYPWRYGGYAWDDSGAEGMPAGSKPLATQTLTLDAAGAARAVLAGLPQSSAPQDLLAHVEYPDANGELLTAATHLTLWPAAVVVGIKPDAWALSRDRLKLQALVTDLKGGPLAGVEVKVDALRRMTYSHRKRLIGGFYAYDHRNEIERLGDLCAGRTDDHGLLICEVKAPADGNLILRARAADGEGRASVANREVWVAGAGEWWFEVGSEDRMDVIPERRRYEPGETAVFQVRMPFREATALVTVEREGVIESFVTTLSGKAPVVEVPIAGNFAPNAFVSVLAVRGRVAGVQPTALIDLGRPAFRLGVAEIKVGWRAHELEVEVQADREAYKVRERATVRVRANTATGDPLPPGAEVAIAAVDEGLLELLPNASWRLLEAVMGRRGIEVETSTAQLQVVGKRHYGRKAQPQGGCCGRQNARELFDTLLLWRGRVPLDANGEAVVEVPLNDSLTTFRIVAVATAGSDRFGTGDTAIRSSQDLMLISGLPPLVREGDAFLATFTVRNATAETKELTVRPALAASAGPAPVPLAEPPEPRTVTLAAGEARELAWDVRVPNGADRIDWSIEANAGDGRGDALKVRQRVIPAVAVGVYQSTLAQLDRELHMTVAPPADALSDRGGVRVRLAPTLAGELDGVREYMSNYPYVCLEQRISAAVALGDEDLWRAAMDSLPAHLDDVGLARYFPGTSQGSDTLTAYILAIAHEAGWAISEEPRTRMLLALNGFVTGRIVRGSALPTADLAIRKLAALEATSRYETVQPALLDSISIEPNLWPTSALLDWMNLLERTEGIPARDARFDEARQILRSRLNFQGTTMGFSTERDDYLWWLMVSADGNANRAILAMLGTDGWEEDLPRLVRCSLGRMRRGHWSTTPANAWGALAMRKFAERFEAEPVSGVTVSELAGGRQQLDWAESPTGGTLEHLWPGAAATVLLAHQGDGRPWATVEGRAAIPLRAPFSSGYAVTRTVTPIEQKTAGVLSRGDLLRVRLEITTQSDMTWVAVSDPIPAGASILGTGLARDSQIATRGEQRQGWVWPAFEERTHEAFRAYYEYVPKGTWAVEYTLRLNNPGRYEMPATRVEAMYAPEMLGELPNAPVVIDR